jgi:hypothetical protein
MKRHSITAIIKKVQEVTIMDFADTFEGEPNHILEIRKAAVNEIIRLHAEEPVETELPEWFTDMKKESEKFLESVKNICEDYNETINNQKQ